MEVTVSTGTVSSTAGNVTNTSGNVWAITNVPSGTNILVTVNDANGCSSQLPVTAPNCTCPVGNAPVSGGDESYCTGAPYPVTADTGGNGTNDYVEDTVPVIATQPLDTMVCPGCSTALTVTASNDDNCQWQQYIGAIWVDLTDSGIHSGTTTNTLSITNASPSDNGNQYRVLISSYDYVCAPTISNIANLTVRVNTVITNRRITQRVKKN